MFWSSVDLTGNQTGKDNFRHYFASVKSAGIVYINKEKAQELERIVKLRLLHDYSSSELDNILQLPKCIVNLKNLAPVLEQCRSDW